MDTENENSKIVFENLKDVIKDFTETTKQISERTTELVKSLSKSNNERQKKFESALGFIRPFFEKEGLPIPEFWERDFLYWYCEKIGEKESYKLHIDDLPFTRDNFVEWSCFEKIRLLQKIKSFEESESNLPLQSKTQESDESEKQKNTFNKMPIEQVQDHFKPLTEKLNPSKEIWMTKDDFEIFLKRSFGGQKELLKPKINIGSRGKYAIVKLFYLYYQKNINEYLQENRNKDPFLNLLKDAFDTTEFKDLRGDNFKPNKNKFDWN